MKIVMNDIDVKSIDRNNREDVSFIKKLFVEKNIISKDMDSDKVINDNIYIVFNKEMIRVGYFSMSSPVVTGSGLNQINLAYGISNEYKNMNYAKDLIKDISKLLLEDQNTMLVLNVNRTDTFGQEVAFDNDFSLEYTDEDNMVFTKYAKSLQKHL